MSFQGPTKIVPSIRKFKTKFSHLPTQPNLPRQYPKVSLTHHTTVITSHSYPEVLNSPGHIVALGRGKWICAAARVKSLQTPRTQFPPSQHPPWRRQHVANPAILPARLERRPAHSLGPGYASKAFDPAWRDWPWLTAFLHHRGSLVLGAF